MTDTTTAETLAVLRNANSVLIDTHLRLLAGELAGIPIRAEALAALSENPRVTAEQVARIDAMLAGGGGPQSGG